MKKVLTIIAIILVLVLLGIGSGVIGLKTDRLPTFLNQATSKLRLSGPNVGPSNSQNGVRVVSEESVTIDIVKKVTPAVVTVGITANQPVFGFDNSDPFGMGMGGFMMPRQQGTRQIKQDIGSGFIIRNDGMIITNKHVVSDTTAKYRVITSDNKSYDVQKIYRDPNNDLAILKIDASNLPTVEMGDSSKLQVGQFALAIGTALGEFRSTVTTGVVSGLSRGITAGGPFSGSEKLDNVIQTSTAINPGNSGGPLLNSAGQVIGVNVAVAQDAQNIGFALPINLVKDSLKAFDSNGGQFVGKAYLGIEYRVVTRDLAIINEIPEGAYILNVLTDGPADKAGVKEGDIITKIDGKMVRDTDGGLSAIVASKKVGDTVELTIYRDSGKTLTLKAVLGEGKE